MRLRVSISGLALLVLACGPAPAEVRDPGPMPMPVRVDLSPAEAPIGDDRPVWEGFAATAGEPQNLAAYARGPLSVYATPDDVEPMATLDRTTILGTVTVLAVADGPVDGWVEVMLPMRPNGSTGWVREEQVSLYVADSEIVVDLSERRLRYLVDGVEILATDVGVGSNRTATPTGRFFVTDRVKLADPNSVWGPYALGLSARSEAITSYNGGDGIIGIHGTSNPDSIGDNVSLGCVRLPNETIELLYELVPLGARVEIRA